jgi:hypothetical protein
VSGWFVLASATIPWVSANGADRSRPAGAKHFAILCSSLFTIAKHDVDRLKSADSTHDREPGKRKPPN